MFADELYCSKSTIVNDLEAIQTILESKNLVLKRRQNQGLWIEGNEKDYRKALKEIVYNSKSIDNADSLNLDIDKLDYRIDFTNYKKIKSMFPKIDIIFIQETIQKAEQMLNFYFTEQAFLNLVTYITIAIERIRLKKYVEGEDSVEFIQNLKINNIKEYEVSNWIVNRLQEKFNITFPEQEVSYIAVNVLGGKVQQYHKSKDIKLLESTCDEQIVRIAKGIMRLSSEILGVNMIDDKNLLTNLILHLRPTIIRLKYGLELKNPMIEVIKRDYTSIFGAVWACNSIFEKELGISINEDEVGYITIHVALAYKNAKPKVKVLVVCSSGIGTSQLIALKLEDQFKDIKIIDIIPFNLLTEQMIKDVDLVVSTVRNMMHNRKIIYVSSLLTDDDLFNIQKAVKDIQRKKEAETLRTINSNIFDSDLVFIDDEHHDYEEALKYYGSLMEKKRYAKNGFAQNLLKREKKGSTYLGKGLGIPHCEEKFVNLSKVCIVRFKEAVFWKGHDIKTIIILCLNFANIYEIREFFKRIYSILENDELINKINTLKDKNKIIEILREGS